MSTAYSGDGITFPDNSVQATAPRVGMVNRIINGDMRIDQRNAGASISGGFPVDRWSIGASQSTKFTAQRNAGSVTPAAGFTNYLGMTSSSAYSVISTDYFFVNQIIEGFNASDFAWGSASATAVTLSFKVYSSLTGTFGGCIKNGSANRSYPFNYTVSSTNTWTTISITIPGDTTGTWATDNSAWGYVIFSLGSGSTRLGTVNTWAGVNYDAPTGSVSVVGTNGATFYVTGVQLEKGSTATDFEYVDYSRQLIQCQRYYEKSYNQEHAPATVTTVGVVWSYLTVTSGTVGDLAVTLQFKADKRVTPTMVFYSPGTGAAGYFQSVSGDVAAAIQFAGQHNCGVYGSVNNGNGQLRVQYTASAEL